MFQVLIVDDEYFDREGLKRTVPWEEYGFALCGEAENGADGLRAAAELRPDLIVTDIKMPGKSGLEMAAQVHQLLPQCRFIITTAYEDVKFAREAIKLSAVDFILKPVDDEELAAAIRRAHDELVISRQQLCRDIGSELFAFLKARPKQPLPAALEPLQKRFPRCRIALARLTAAGKGVPSEPLCREIAAAQNERHTDLLWFVRAAGELLLFVPEDAGAALLKERRAEAETAFHLRATIGLSPAGAFEDLHRLYRDAKLSLQDCLYGGIGAVCESAGRGHHLFPHAEMKELETQLFRSADRTQEETVDRIIGEAVSLLRKKQPAPADLLRWARAVAWKFAVLLDDRELRSDSYVLMQSYDLRAAALSSLDDVEALLRITAHTALRCLSSGDEETGMREIRLYIADHFREDLSLAELAEHFYLNPAYLSAKIKKVFGISFVEYLTRLRMEAALELLRQGQKSVNAIAAAVGYNDYRYFSSLFKKYYGKSPRDWQHANPR